MSGPLAVKLTADVSAYEKAMVRARDLAVRHASDIASNFQSAAGKIDLAFAALESGRGLQALASLPGLARNAALAFAGFTAIKFALDETTRAAEAASKRLEELVEIANKAKGAGVGTTFLQSLTGQAKELGTEAGKLVDMLNRAREAATTRIGEGKDAASSAIEDRLRQNVAAGNLSRADLARYTSADSQEARIRVVLDLLDQLRAKGANLAALDIGGRMFGAEFEAKLRSGTDMIGAMRRALDGLTVGADGRIIPPEEIQRAEAMRQQLTEIERKLSEALRPINEDIARWEQQQLQGWIDIKAQLADVVVLAGQVYASINSVGDYISGLGNAKPFQALRDFLDQAGMIDKDSVAKIERQLNGGLTTETKTPPKDADAGGPLSIRVAPKRDTSRSLPSLTPAKSTGAGTSEVDEIQRFIDGLNKSAAALKAQADNFSKSNVEQRVAIELARANEVATAAGKTVTEAQAAAITKAAAAAATYKDKLADLDQAQRQSADLARTFGNALSDSFADAILEGKSFANIMRDLEGQLVRIALRGLLTGEGPLAGLLGTAPAASAGSNAVGGLMGGLGKLLGFAEGGHVTGPGTGTSDSIVARLSSGEFVVNAAATARHRAVLEAINQGSVHVPRFASGGYVGSTSAPAGSDPAASMVTISPTIHLNTNGGGSTAANADLATQVGKQVQGAMRQLVVEELRGQMRPGGMLRR